MNLRNTALLFGLSLGMLWLFGLMVASKRTTFDESLLLPTFQAETDIALESITIKRKDTEKEKPALDFNLVKTETGWSLKSGKNSVRLSDGQVSRIIKELKDAAKIDESDASPDPVTNGLANPQLTVTIKAKTGKDKDVSKEWQLNVGKESADKARYFVSSSDRPGRVMVVAASSLDSLFPPLLKDENSLRSQQPFEFNEPSVAKVILKQDKTELELKKAEDGSWRIVKPPTGPAEYEGPALPKEPFAMPKKQTATSGVKSLIDKILGLKVDSENDFVPPTADVNSPDYGLEPGKESLRIQVDLGGGKEQTLLVGKKVPAKDFHFAHMQNDAGIFMLSAKQLESFGDYLKKPGELRSTNIIFVDPKKVDMVKVSIGKEKIVLTHAEEKPWQMQVGDAKPAQANEQAVDDIFKALEGKREIQKFYDVEGNEAKKLDAELGLDGSLGEVALYAESQPKKTKDEKKDEKAEKKDEKKETKAAVTLIFGKGDKDSVPVKRIQQDGTVSRFSLAKASVDKIIPPDARMAFLDTALPPVPYEDVDSLVIDRGKEKLEFVRGTGANAGRWLLKTAAVPSLADNAKVDGFVRRLANMRANKWLKKIDDKKPDLVPYGLEPPVVTATLVVRKTTPASAASLTGLLSSSFGGVATFESAAFWLAVHQLGKPETVTLRFGKETEDDKDKPGSFAWRDGDDLLFLTHTDFVKALKSEDFRDRSMLLAMQQILDASAVSAGPANLLLKGPIVTATVNSFEPTKIKEFRLEVHQYDLRKFHFLRQAPDKAKEKVKSDKPGVRGQVWQDQSGLIDFTLDSDKVNTLAEEFARFKAERIVSLADGPKPDFKLDAKDAILKVEATLESGQVVTLMVGARFLHHGYFAQSSAWPGAVFLIAPDWVETYLRGTAYFGKDRVARE